MCQDQFVDAFIQCLSGLGLVYLSDPEVLWHKRLFFKFYWSTQKGFFFYRLLFIYTLNIIYQSILNVSSLVLYVFVCVFVFCLFVQTDGWVWVKKSHPALVRVECLGTAQVSLGRDLH